MKLKLYILTLLFFSIWLAAFAQSDPENIELLGQYDDDNLPSIGGLEYNDVWGYANEAGEFAIVGGAEHILFIDVTDPANLDLILQFDAGDKEIWRDFKTYENYVFGVCDSCNEGIHVFSTDGATVTHEYTTTAFFGKAHNIYIDEENDRLYAAGVPGLTDLIVIDISDPMNLELIENINFGNSGDGFYVHDVFVKNNIAYCNHGWDGFYVWDLTNPSAPIELGKYVTGNYNHSCWITKNDDYIIYAEEVGQGLPLGVVDLTNLGSSTEELELVKEFQNTLLPDEGYPTPHNPYIKGDTLYVSYYEDGLKIYDVADPTDPQLIGQYDTHTNSSYSGTEGNWGTYPYLPSGNILATDIDNGLYVLRYAEECEPDNDMDGYCADVDCDDSNPDINPGVPELCDGIDNNCDGEIDESINCLDVKAILSGAYQSSTENMQDNLKRFGLLPLTEPYTGFGYNFVGGGGEEIDDPLILAIEGDNSIVDWVVIELRNSSDNTEVIYSRAALIQRDGDIVEVDGVSRVDCSVAEYADYFLVLRHRNHLGVMSEDPLNLSVSNSFNLSDGSIDLYGTDPIYEISSGLFGLWSGNANMDGQIKYNGSSNDKNSILGEVGLFTPNNIVSGYLNEDVNMDGKVKYNGSSNDKNSVLSIIGLFTPNNVVTEQIPD